MHKLVLCAALGAAVLIGERAPAQNLVANLVTGNGSAPGSDLPAFHVIGNLAVFAPRSPFEREPWVTDGTAAGTHLLADLSPMGSSDPLEMTVLGNEVLFTAFVPGLGRELWKTDGTTAGTVLVADVFPVGSAEIRHLARLGGYVYFQADDGVHGAELWRSDGSAAGTTMVKDIWPGGPSSSPTGMVSAGGYVWFWALTAVAGVELWRSDGTAAGTAMVVELDPNGWTNFTRMAPFGNGVLFAADAHLGNGEEPYFSDGTAAGTVLLGDFRPGSAGSVPMDFTAIGVRAVFSADDGSNGRELWTTDGTAAGTSLIDIEAASDLDPEGFFVDQGRVMFSGYTLATGREPWVSDGTVSGTAMLADVFVGGPGSNPGSFARIGNAIWFGASRLDVGTEFFTTDGTIGNAQPLMDYIPGTGGIYPRAITPFGAGALFAGSFVGAGDEPGFTDGSIAGTVLLADCQPAVNDSRPTEFATLGSRVFFAAGTDTAGTEPLVSDGTPAGTSILADIRSGTLGSSPNYAASVGNRVYFVADTGAGRQLFVTDGTLAGTVQLTSLGTSFEPRGVTGAAAGVIFSGFDGNGREPWVSDGTVAGTHRLIDANPGAASSIGLLAEDFTIVGARAFFSLDDGTHGRELWVTNGTAAGTQLVADLVNGPATSNPRHLTAVGNLLYFTADVPGSGDELWVSDGTAAGTLIAADVVAGPISSFPRDLTASPNGLWFVASSGGAREVCLATGVGAFHSVTGWGAGVVEPHTDLTAACGGLFFRSDDHSGDGTELWFSDGTVAGTHLVIDIAPGEMDGAVGGTLTAVLGGSQLLFGGWSPAEGLELWISNGTATGTQQVSHFGPPGRGAAAFSDFFDTGTRVFFACNDGIVGDEPWVYDPTTAGVAFVLPYGEACDGTPGAPAIGAVGLPQLGNASFAITLANAQPLAFAAQVISFAPASIFWAPGCRQYVANPMLTGLTLVTDAAGAGSAPLPIPADPSYVGLNLFYQWVIVDAGGGILGAFSASDALQVVLGN